MELPPMEESTEVVEELMPPLLMLVDEEKMSFFWVLDLVGSPLVV